jgi:hypothetical protein
LNNTRRINEKAITAIRRAAATTTTTTITMAKHRY